MVGALTDGRTLKINTFLVAGHKNGMQTDVILLDFNKAFDKVNNEMLIYKLHGNGIRDNTLAGIKVFLEDCGP